MQQFNESYTSSRSDVLTLVSVASKKILDVGCSTGQLGRAIKSRQPAQIIGIENDYDLALKAQEYLDEVIISDAENPDCINKLQGHSFDTIILADILEHMRDPWSFVTEIAKFLNANGAVVASIPNIQFYEIFINIAIKRRWPYRERGIYDRTHLRFFTLKNIRELFEQAGLQIQSLHKNYRVLERPHRLNRFGVLFALFGNFFVFQYLVIARRRYNPTH